MEEAVVVVEVEEEEDPGDNRVVLGQDVAKLPVVDHAPGEGNPYLARPLGIVESNRNRVEALQNARISRLRVGKLI